MKFLVLTVISLTFAAVNSHFTVTRTGSECNPRRRISCGEFDLLEENSGPAEGYGDNVCKITKIYEVQTLKYVNTEICFRRRCRTYCKPTFNCTGPMKNVTVCKIKCCEGFAIDPEDVEGSYRFRYSKRRVLRNQGCGLVLEKSVADCLLNLNLTMFTAEILQVPDLLGRLEKENEESEDEEKFTVFALPNAAFDGQSVSVEGHVVNSQVLGKKLRRGKILESLMSNITLHIGKATTRNGTIFSVNGVEITEVNACQARNGVVHLVAGPIPQSSKTIAEILTPGSEYSTFRRLLDATNITQYLEVAYKSRTVFAPTDNAFDDLPVLCFLNPENKDYLLTLVLIHIGFPAEYSSTLSLRTMFSTFTRYYLVVAEEDGTIFVTRDRIPLEKLDMPAINGVIHTLPKVILPPGNPCTVTGA